MTLSSIKWPYTFFSHFLEKWCQNWPNVEVWIYCWFLNHSPCDFARTHCTSETLNLSSFKRFWRWYMWYKWFRLNLSVKFFHYSLYIVLLHGTSLQKFWPYFSPVTYFNHSAFDWKQFLHALTTAVYDVTRNWTVEMTQMSADARCLSELVFPCTPRTVWKYSL